MHIYLFRTRNSIIYCFNIFLFFTSHDIDIRSSQSNNVYWMSRFFLTPPLNNIPMIHLLYVYRCTPMIQVCVLVPTYDTDTCTVLVPIYDTYKFIGAHIWYTYCIYMGAHSWCIYCMCIGAHLWYKYVYWCPPMIHIRVLVPTSDTGTCLDAPLWYHYVFWCSPIIQIRVLMPTYMPAYYL